MSLLKAFFNLPVGPLGFTVREFLGGALMFVMFYIMMVIAAIMDMPV